MSEVVDNLDAFFSRENAVKMPVSMATTIYLSRKFNLFRLSPEGNLYQYTDVNGLYGILNSNRIWATATDYMNDPSELNYIVNVAKNVIDSKRKDGINDFFLDAIVAEIDRQRILDVYAACFCRDGDLLSQWRSYASFGAGYAIGFACERMIPPVQVGILHEMIYDEALAAAAITELLDIIIEFNQNKNWLKQAVSFFYESLHIIATYFKHPGFSEEHEVRFNNTQYRNSEIRDEMLTNNPVRHEIKFRTKTPHIIPYIEITPEFPHILTDDYRLPIVEIVVGPGVDFDRAKHALSHLLQKIKMGHVNVRPSQIPLRA